MTIKKIFFMSTFLTYSLVCNGYASDDGWGFLSPEELAQLRQAAEQAEIDVAMGRFAHQEVFGGQIQLSAHEQEAWSAFALQKRVRDALREMPHVSASSVGTNITNSIPLSVATPSIQAYDVQEDESLHLAREFERQQAISAQVEAMLLANPDADVSFLFEQMSQPMPTPVTPSVKSVVRSTPKAQPVRQLTQSEMEERSAYVQELLSRDPDADISDLFNPSIPLPIVKTSRASVSYASDAALAQQLAQEERETVARAVFQASSAPVLESGDRAIYLNILASFLAISDDVDVHTMTRSFCARWYADIKMLEQKYLGYTNALDSQSYMRGLEVFKADLRTNAFQDHFSASALANQFRLMNSLLETNKGFWVQGARDVDAETQQSLREVFAHVYTFACRMDAKKSERMGREVMEYRGLFCSKLAENIETDGGCHPGITGRLVALYGTMIFAAFGLQGS